MDEEAVGFFGIFGGGFSALLSIALIVMAVNNPTASDLKSEVAVRIQQDIADNANPFVSMLSQQIGMVGADALSIKSTNFIVFTHFEVVTPDARLFGGPSSEQVCLFGVMNSFIQCDSIPFFGSQSQQASSAQDLSQAALDPTPGEAGAPSGSAQAIDRPQGWLCDGVRVRFQDVGTSYDLEEIPEDPSSFMFPYKVTIAGQASDWDSYYTNCSRSCPNGPPQYFVPKPGSRFGQAQFAKEDDLMFNGRVCRPVR